MRTSVNLRAFDIPNLVEACKDTSKTHSELICSCLRKLFTSFPERLAISLINNLVEYQPKGVGYCIRNIVFDVDVYNFAVNFRNFSRISVSKMVTIAMENFLEEVVAEIKNNENSDIHNYGEYSHFKRHNSTNNCPEWGINWLIWSSENKNQIKQKKK